MKENKYAVICTPHGKTLEDVKDEVSMLLHMRYNGDLSCEDPDDIACFIIDEAIKALRGAGKE